jgi:hypothetical protein
MSCAKPEQAVTFRPAPMQKTRPPEISEPKAPDVTEQHQYAVISVTFPAVDATEFVDRLAPFRMDILSIVNTWDGSAIAFIAVPAGQEKFWVKALRALPFASAVKVALKSFRFVPEPHGFAQMASHTNGGRVPDRMTTTSMSSATRASTLTEVAVTPIAIDTFNRSFASRVPKQVSYELAAGFVKHQFEKKGTVVQTHEEPDLIQFEITALKGEVTLDNRLWEKLTVQVIIFPLLSSDETMFYITINGYFTAGLGKEPKMATYVSMEPQYADKLISYTDSFGVSLRRHIGKVILKRKPPTTGSMDL